MTTQYKDSEEGKVSEAHETNHGTYVTHTKHDDDKEELDIRQTETERDNAIAHRFILRRRVITRKRAKRVINKLQQVAGEEI
jgi:hypothetical protein